MSQGSINKSTWDIWIYDDICSFLTGVQCEFVISCCPNTGCFCRYRKNMEATSPLRDTWMYVTNNSRAYIACKHKCGQELVGTIMVTPRLYVLVYVYLCLFLVYDQIQIDAIHLPMFHQIPIIDVVFDHPSQANAYLKSKVEASDAGDSNASEVMAWPWPSDFENLPCFLMISG